MSQSFSFQAGQITIMMFVLKIQMQLIAGRATGLNRTIQLFRFIG